MPRLLTARLIDLTDNALSNIGHQLISDYTKWSGCLDLAKTAVGS